MKEAALSIYKLFRACLKKIDKDIDYNGGEQTNGKLLTQLQLVSYTTLIAESTTTDELITRS